MTATRTARNHAPRWPLAWLAMTLLGCTTVGSGGVGGFSGLDIQLSGDSAADVATGADDGIVDDGNVTDSNLDDGNVAHDTGCLDAADDGNTSGDSVVVHDSDDAIHVADVSAPDSEGDGDDPGGDSSVDDALDADVPDGESDVGESDVGDGNDAGLDDAIVGADIVSDGLGIGDGAGTDAANTDAANTDAANTDVNDADAPPTGPPPAVPLSSCKGSNGSKTCSVDGKLRLECILGAWTPLAHCGFGVCAAKAQDSGPAQLSCSVPTSAHAELATACARIIGCFAPSQSLERCMRAALAPSFEAADAGNGILVDPILATFASLQPALACISTSNTCTSLAQCVHLFTQPKCNGGAQSGCDGNLAWQCSGGAALVGDCAKIGVNCAIVAGQPRCLADAPCPIGDVSTCTGRVGTVCLQTSAGNRAAKIDCGALGLQCAANINATSNIATGCGPASACPAAGSGIPACEAAKLATCTANKLVETTCPAQSVCLLQDDFGLLAPTCAPNSNCETALCGQGGSCSHVSRCQGSEVWYCEQGQPRSFDCASIGKTCVAGANPRCS